MTRYMRGIQAAGLGGDRNGMPPGGGYIYRGTKHTEPTAARAMDRPCPTCHAPASAQCHTADGVLMVTGNYHKSRRPR